MQYIGKLNRDKLGRYGNKIVTEDVILTEERKIHIYENHVKDYDIIIKNISDTVQNPREIFEDAKNMDTIILIRELENNSLNVVIKLNVSNNNIYPKNSIMTAWIIRDNNLKKIRKRNKLIYKRK